MKGQIVKITASKYVVYDGENFHKLLARGSVKFKSGKLSVGDYVEFSDGAVSTLYPRKSKFIRPNVANIDLVNIVIGSPPKPDYVLIDKIIISAINGGASVIITVNKCDLSNETYEYVIKNYSSSVDKIFSVSSLTGENIDELKLYLKDKLCAFVGQSAVGKTSLLNKLFSIENRVGELSEKTMRGKHTTTGSQIYFYDDCKIIDTPGFSANICDVKSSEIKDCYKEFTKLSKTCYFLDCKHISEPDCGVKQALDNGEISLDRYNRYIEIYNEKVKEEKYERR